MERGWITFCLLWGLIHLYSCSDGDKKNNHNKDPLYPFAWHLKNTGQKVFSSKAATLGIDLRVEEVWGMGITGKGIRIAVSDSGLDIGHEEFRGQLLDGEHRNYDDLSFPWIGDPSPTDNGADHGTGVAGMIAMAAKNGKGSRGVAYGAKIAGFKGGYGNGEVAYLDAAQGDFDIFNYSWGANTCGFEEGGSLNVVAQLKRGVETLRDGKGAIYVKGAGNGFIGEGELCDRKDGDNWGDVFVSDSSVNFEHSFPWVLVVGAVSADGVKASYSRPGSSLWVTAPGGEREGPGLISTDVSGCQRGFHVTARSGDLFGGDANKWDPLCHYASSISGTSFSTPMVSGVIALILQANPELTWRDVKHILAITSRKIDSDRSEITHPLDNMDLAGHTYQQTWVTNAADYSFHNWYGFGMVDAAAAVKAAKDYDTDLGDWTEGASVESAELNTAIPDNSAAGLTHQLRVSDDLVIETVQIKVTLTHSFVGEIGIELSSPSGTKSILLPINSLFDVGALDGQYLLSNAFYGESSQGNWTIKIVDPRNTRTGTLTKWSIKVFGH